jgi:adenine-specific DNA-methyltransferase
MNSNDNTSSLELEKVSLSRIRQLGAYYTPDKIASAIASWAIRAGNEKILEPSAGGGALLNAAYEKVRAISPLSTWHATAFDIDSNAIKQLRKLMIDGLTVHHADFLSVHPTFHDQVDLVLANPPFTRNHEILPIDRQKYRERFGIKGAVGLWVYFILHSLAFLKRGGRIASIVPRSALFTHHGKELLEQLSLNFLHVGVYELASKPNWSNYAEESGAVILAEGYQCGGASTFERGILEDNGTTKPIYENNSTSFNRILEKSVMLGDFASLSIGAVTGRNSVFLLNKEEKAAAGISDIDVRPVVSRRRQINGITLTTKDLARMAEEGQKTWLLSPHELTKSIQEYLKIVPENDRKTTVWFKKRSPWWKVQLASSYDAVFTYMNDLGPRLVRLDPNIVCTNTLHRVQFKPIASKCDRLAALLSPISTFGQLAAEKIGRAYSGGVLKFELSEAKKLPIVKCSAFNEELVSRVDEMLRRQEISRATAAVDEAFMAELFGNSWRDAQIELDAELAALRQARRKNIKRSTDGNSN